MRPLTAEDLRGLPGIHEVATEGEELLVRGEGDVLHTVSSHVHAAGTVTVTARLGQATLEDAFVALTDRDQVPEELRQQEVVS